MSKSPRDFASITKFKDFFFTISNKTLKKNPGPFSVFRFENLIVVRSDVKKKKKKKRYSILIHALQDKRYSLETRNSGYKLQNKNSQK